MQQSMKELFSKTSFYLKSVSVFVSLGLMLILSACSNTVDNNNSNTVQTLNQQQRVETGTVVAVRMVQLKPNANKVNNPLSNVGIAAGSGGFRGVYGSIDLATIGRLFNSNAQTKTAQEIIVNKSNGQTVVITQALKENFKRGDAVKILVRNGYAQVIH